MPDLHHAKNRSYFRAQDYTPEDRTILAVRALAHEKPITEIAQEAGVSRKFIRGLKRRAESALEDAFKRSDRSDEVLFHIPVTVGWIKSVIVVLMLVCHAPFRGIQEFLRVMCAHEISLGSIHKIAREAAGKAKELNSKEDLSGIQQGAHDEIFQAGTPVLVGVDVKSSYCFMLEQVEHRDATTWGCALLDALDRGFNPDLMVADFGSGLRAGLREAFGSTPCQGDVFHFQMEFGKAVRFLENRAYKAMDAADQAIKPCMRRLRKGVPPKVEEVVECERAVDRMKAAIALADNIATLQGWTIELLQLSGPSTRERRDLLLWIVEQMKLLEPAAAWRIGPVRRLLEGHLDDLLLFASILDQKLEQLASELKISEKSVRKLLMALKMGDEAGKSRLVQEMRDLLRDRYHLVEQRIQEVIQQAPARASSLVENLNSRLRNYFFLRKQLGPAYLGLLRFFLNHHRFERSASRNRRGRSAAEALAGGLLPSWTEALGLTTFQVA